MVAACAATLVLDGQLDIQSPVRQWLPELPAWSDDVRIRHLIHHTSGLPGDAALQQHIAANGQHQWDSPAVMRALQNCSTLQFRPGSAYQYCNAGYICLVAVLERVTDTPFTDLALHQLFEPLHMRQSLFCDHHAAVPAGAAAGNPDDEHGERWPLPLSLGDGGAWSTVNDLQRWNDALLPGGSIDGRVRALIHAPGRLEDGRPIDYAWGVRVSRENGVLIHSHGGNWPGGWTAKAIRLPDLGVTITALANNGDVPSMIELTERILDRYTRAPAPS